MRLTERGQALRPAFEEVSEVLNRRLLGGFREEEVRSLEGMLDRLRANLREE